jgi:hypothetical protein
MCARDRSVERLADLVEEERVLTRLKRQDESCDLGDTLLRQEHADR